MRPAFTSTKGAAAFLLLLLLLVAAPLLAGKRFLPPRKEIYFSTSWRFGPYPYMQRQIYEETNPLAIAFMGSSHAWYGINTPYLQQELSRKEGQDLPVVTLCWFWHGFDTLYFIAKDLLDHRQVRMLVICNEQATDAFRPQGAANHWFRYGDGAEDLAGLSFHSRFSFYAAAILGMPRNLLWLVRTNYPVNPDPISGDFYNVFYNADNPTSHLGSLSVRWQIQYGSNFVTFVPTNHVPADAACVYGPGTHASFQFDQWPLQTMQLFFLKKLVALAREHGTKLVVLHCPTTNEFNSATIPERLCWPEVLGDDVSLVGISGSKLFAGLTDEQKKLLFCDPDHLNQNGQKYFTPAITPALIQLYESQVHH